MFTKEFAIWDIRVIRFSAISSNTFQLHVHCTLFVTKYLARLILYIMFSCHIATERLFIQISQQSKRLMYRGISTSLTNFIKHSYIYLMCHKSTAISSFLQGHFKSTHSVRVWMFLDRRHFANTGINQWERSGWFTDGEQYRRPRSQRISQVYRPRSRNKGRCEQMWIPRLSHATSRCVQSHLVS